ncbi:phage portal protein [Actinoplanes aureus]|uniref:Phage portal protein n=1 Tax=Actinoplanes aureus TaxID=2792083 RepID=A0A931C3J4_9ACTN|nr:phage portal protein [Actinoplanes aureus]MBG0560717.1 phage portal protein [Actinoplanes aureus]
MPIPTGGAWPPPHLTPAYDAYRDWDAWYAGDPDGLRAVYSGRGPRGQVLPPSQRVRSGQYAGGLLGAVSRFLWGAPPPAGQRDGRLHVPLPADLAATSANLLFSELPKITHEDKAIQERIERLEEDGLTTLLLHAAEAASALGDVYLRPVVDEDVLPGRAFFATVHADGAIPLIRWGRLVEVTFWSTLLVDGDTHVRLLEHHEVVGGAGRIVYAVYEGTSTTLGRPVPLTEHADAAHLADLVDEESAQATELDRLDVVRVPNAGPQRRWRTSGPLKYFGRSDFDGNEQFFDALDETWTDWMRDIRLARGRIIVPAYMLQSHGPGRGASFDMEQEIFTQLEMMPGQQSGPAITANQFAIRWQEHQATADAIEKVAMRHAGLSAQTLGEDGGDVAMTATEAQARERQSFTTRGNRIGTWRPAIAELIELLLAVERARFRTGPEPDRPNVEFGDSVSESPETLARTLQLLEAAQAVSVDTKVRMLHPDWDDPQVREEVERIQNAGATATEPELTLGRLAGNQPPADDGEENPEE